MVEMLGVLAIMGVLSVMGITGFRRAMDSHKANAIIQAVSKRSTVLAADKNFGTGFTPSDTFGNDTSYTITCEDKQDTNFFVCTVEGVPQKICEKILNLDWKIPTLIIPTTCDATNDMVFTFNQDLDGAGTLCTDDTECPTPQATCINGVCAEPALQTCNLDTAEDPNNPCGDECQICNPDTNKCEYACVRKQYLQSDGGQYIDTKFKPDQNTSVELHFTGLSSNGEQDYFGSSASGMGYVYGFYDGKSNVYDNYGDDINVKGGHISGTMLLKKNKNVTSVTGSYTIEKTHTKKNFQAVSDMYLFARNRGGVFRAAQMKCYYFKIWDNGTLVRDFIPVLSPTDEPCMYDKVTKGLFCNQGSGDFITD